MEAITINNWKLILTSNNSVKVENLKTGIVDYPLRYNDGAIGYDRPELIPNYVKAAVQRLFIKHGLWPVSI